MPHVKPSEPDERAVGVDRRGARANAAALAGGEVVRIADVESVRTESAVRGLLAAIQEDRTRGRAADSCRCRSVGCADRRSRTDPELVKPAAEDARRRIRRGSKRRPSSRCQCRGRSRTLHRTGSRSSRSPTGLAFTGRSAACAPETATRPAAETRRRLFTIFICCSSVFTSVGGSGPRRATAPTWKVP